jgi:predicted enzyme related to lactoylglutathione lyase
VQLIVQVADVDAAIAAALARGGQVVVPRSVLPDGEVMAIVRDPFGTTVGVMTPPA